MGTGTKAYLWLILCAAVAALVIVLALQFGLYILYGLAAIAGLAALRFGIMPIVKSGAETASIIVETRQRCLETRIAREEHEHRMKALPSGVYLAKPDTYGNYEQFIGVDGRIRAYLPPGNPGESQSASTFNQYQEIIEGQAQVLPDKQLLLNGPEDKTVDPATVEAPTFAQDLANNVILPGEPMMIGYRIVVDEFTGKATLEAIEDPDGTSIFIVGGSTCGKSTLVSSILARMAARGDTVFIIIDPHKNNKDRSITAKIFPALEPWLAYPVVGNDPKELKKVVKFIRDLIELRFGDNETLKQRHPLRGLKVRVIVDEALLLAMRTRISDHDKVYDELLLLMQEMAVGTAKEGVTYIAMAQLSTKEQLGDIDIRDVCPTSIILKTPKQSALALQLTGEQAKMCHFFTKGRGFITLAEGGEPELFVWGFTTAQDIEKLAANLISPLQKGWKGDGSKIVHLHSAPTLPDWEIRSEEGESGLKEDGKEIGNQFPLALQAELEKIRDWEGKLNQLGGLIGEEQAVIFKSIWDCTPGRGERYVQAKAEYTVLVEALRCKLRNAS